MVHNTARRHVVCPISGYIFPPTLSLLGLRPALYLLRLLPALCQLRLRPALYLLGLHPAIDMLRLALSLLRMHPARTSRMTTLWTLCCGRSCFGAQRWMATGDALPPVQ
jgi:hypothetical protein